MDLDYSDYVKIVLIVGIVIFISFIFLTHEHKYEDWGNYATYIDCDMNPSNYPLGCVCYVDHRLDCYVGD